MQKVIATEILKSIRKHLDNPDLSDEEKLDYITFEAGTELNRLQQKAAYKIENLCLHLAKQIQFPTWEDWSREMARNYLNSINKPLRRIKKKNFKIDFIKQDFRSELENEFEAREVLEKAVEEVKEGAYKRGLSIPKIQNRIKEDKFLKVWEYFYTCLIPELGKEKTFQKKDVRTCIEQALNKAGLKIEFLWR